MDSVLLRMVLALVYEEWIVAVLVQVERVLVNMLEVLEQVLVVVMGPVLGHNKVAVLVLVLVLV